MLQNFVLRHTRVLHLFDHDAHYMEYFLAHIVSGRLVESSLDLVKCFATFSRYLKEMMCEGRE